MFENELRVLVTRFAVGLLEQLSYHLVLEWDDLVSMLRHVLAVKSVQLFGSHLAILLPLISNIISTRIKHLFDDPCTQYDWLENQFTNSHSVNCSIDPPVQDKHMSLPESSESHHRGVSQERSNSVDQEQSDQRHFTDRPRPFAMDHGIPRRKNEADNEAVCLDDGELDELIAELGAELHSHPEKGHSTNAHLDELARELESDFVAQAKHHHRLHCEENTRRSLLRPTPAGLSAAAQYRGFGAPPGMVNANTSMNSTSNNSTNALSFAPPVPSSRARALSNRDVFDEGLNPADAKVWRHVVNSDVAAMRSKNICNPLSRAYRFDTSPVPILDDHRATAIAVESARSAANAACLSQDATEQLLRAAAESGNDYLHELEIAISSRLGTDNEFSSERFPDAFHRFMSA